MRTWIMTLFVAAILTACNSNTTEGVKIFYGAKFDVNTPITTDQLITAIDNNDTAKTQVSGIIEKSCSHRGCWITLENEADKKIFVSYKDDAFTTAKKIDGKKVTLIGNGSHNAEKNQYEFVADGVILN